MRENRHFEVTEFKPTILIYMRLERLGNQSSRGYHLFNISLVKGIIFVEINLAKGIIFTKIGLANILKPWAAHPYPKFSREPPLASNDILI